MARLQELHNSYDKTSALFFDSSLPICAEFGVASACSVASACLFRQQKNQCATHPQTKAITNQIQISKSKNHMMFLVSQFRCLGMSSVAAFFRYPSSACAAIETLSCDFACARLRSHCLRWAVLRPSRVLQNEWLLAQVRPTYL